MTAGPVDPKPPTKQRRGGVKADALIAAAHRLVLEHGENFTTQDLIREADVGLQTLYRNFGGKDQLLVAVMADLIQAQCDALRDRAASTEDPVDRLRFYITDTLTFLTTMPEARVAARFMTSQRWRLHQLLPHELAAADRPFVELVREEIELATAAGALRSLSPERDAELTCRLVMASFHHHLYAETDAASDVGEEVWRYCFAALGGSLPR